jgi:hypothetical protein
MLAIYVRAARREEEKFARGPLAAAYERYRSQTGMLLPKPAELFRRGRGDRESFATGALRSPFRSGSPIHSKQAIIVTPSDPQCTQRRPRRQP